MIKLKFSFKVFALNAITIDGKKIINHFFFDTKYEISYMQVNGKAKFCTIYLLLIYVDFNNLLVWREIFQNTFNQNFLLIEIDYLYNRKWHTICEIDLYLLNMEKIVKQNLNYGTTCFFIQRRVILHTNNLYFLEKSFL